MSATAIEWTDRDEQDESPPAPCCTGKAARVCGHCADIASYPPAPKGPPR